jgi:PAS domain S-box-containing protein
VSGKLGGVFPEVKKTHPSIPTDVFAQAFGSNPAAIAITRLKDGVLIGLNEACASLFGLGKDGLVGRSVPDLNLLVSPADRIYLIDELRKNGPLRNREVIMRRLSSQTFTALMSADLMAIAGEEVVISTLLDITERKRAEETLRESEERFRGLVGKAVDGIFLAGAQGRYIDTNSAGVRMLGYTLEEIRNLSITDVILPEEIERMPKQMADLATAGVVTSEWQFRRKDGSTSTGEVVGRGLPDGRLLAILRDVTERKTSEKALRASEERFRAIYERAP